MVGLLIVAAILRLVPLLSHDWALGDGGLFHGIIGDVLAAGFGLPETVSYQGGVIPFSYPPVGFYIAAALEEGLGVARSDVLRVLPATFAVASVGVMALVAAELGPTRRHAVLAAAYYGAAIGLVDALAAGGGLTRSLGLLLAMVATWLGFRMYRGGQWRYVAATAVASGLALLSHPQTGPIIAVALGAAWLTRWRTWRGFVQIIAAGLGGIAVVLPWAVAVTARHGLEPFISAATVPERDLFASLVAYLFLFLLATPAIGLLDIVGQVQQGLARRPHLLVWRVGVFVLDLRFSPVAGAAPVSLLAAHGTLDLLVPAAWRLAARRPTPTPERQRSAWRRVVVAVVLVLAFIPTVVTTRDLTEPPAALTPAQREAMTWVRDTTAPATWTVSLATGRWGSDDVSEWFPALSERRSATTTQGYEWLGEPHRRQHAAEAELRTCQAATDVAGCVDAWLDEHVATDPSVVYVDDGAGPDDLAAQLVAEHGYIVLYDNEAGTIVARGG
jgi:4-amino-4-deoxy-L-arabinose transferase-like glycosyltransferase